MAFSIWWLTSLNGLPDIGDPFDVTAFRAFRVPDDQNAFTFFDEQTRSSPPFGGQRGEWDKPGRTEFFVVDGEPDVAGVGRGESRAFELFQRGAEQPDASQRDGDPQMTSILAADILAILEGTRRHDSGATAAPGTIIVRSCT